MRPRLRPRTIASYEGTANRYLRRYLGHIAVAKLTPADVAGMMPALARTELSATTRRYPFVVLRAALTHALRAGYVTRNVADTDRPSAPRQSRAAPLHDRAGGTAPDRDDRRADRTAARPVRDYRAPARRGAGTHLAKCGSRRRRVHRSTYLRPRHPRARSDEDGQEATDDPPAEGRSDGASGATSTAGRDGTRRRPTVSRPGSRLHHPDRDSARREQGPTELPRGRDPGRSTASPVPPSAALAATTLLEAGEDLYTVSRVLGHASITTRPTCTATSRRQRCDLRPTGWTRRWALKLVRKVGQAQKERALSDDPGGLFYARHKW